MYKLYIDSTDRYEKILELKDGDGVIGEKRGDLDLVDSIRELLEENNLKVTDIDEVIPNLGPGSFTGLKMGVTVANILNWVNGNKNIEELDVPDYGRAPNITLKKF